MFPVVAAFLLLAHPAAAADVPRVAVSILPLHSLVSELMRGVGAPQLLMQAGESPHTSQLKPSRSRALDAADLIVWVGPALEQSLQKSIANRIAERGAAGVITLMARDELELLPRRRGGVWAESDHDHGHGHGHGDDHGSDSEHDDHADGHDDHGHEDEHDDHGHDDHGDEHGEHDDHGHDDDHGDHSDHADDEAHIESDDLHRIARIDPHLWLSTANAAAIASVVARALSRIDPANRARYAANADDLIARIAALRQTLDADLDSARGSHYIVFHDAYQYFEHEFELRPAGAVTISPDRLPGAKRMREIVHIIEARDVRCVFSEPQFPPALMEALGDGAGVATGVLDPLGAALRPGAGAWFALMHGLADALRACLR